MPGAFPGWGVAGFFFLNLGEGRKVKISIDVEQTDWSAGPGRKAWMAQASADGARSHKVVLGHDRDEAIQGALACLLTEMRSGEISVPKPEPPQEASPIVPRVRLEYGKVFVVQPNGMEKMWINPLNARTDILEECANAACREDQEGQAYWHGVLREFREIEGTWAEKAKRISS